MTANQPNPAQQASDAFRAARIAYARVCPSGVNTRALEAAIDAYQAARELTAAQGVDVDAIVQAVIGESTRRVAGESPGASWKRIVKLVITLSQPIEPQGAVVGDVWEAYKSWPEDVRAKLSCHDLRRMSGWTPRQNPTEWGIDTSAGRPILVYQNCSVIEDEQARYVLGLIAKEAALPVAVGAGEDKDAARGRFLISQMAFENDDDPEGGQWYSHAYLKADAIPAPVGSPYFTSVEEIIDAAMTPATPAGKGSHE